jgi:hypothetical protein
MEAIGAIAKRFAHGGMIGVLLPLAALFLWIPSSAALEIDNFRNATKSHRRDALAQRGVGTRQVTESRLASVLGGGRHVRVTATRVQFESVDVISAIVVPESAVLSYESSSGADGTVDLVYDGGGSGLNANLTGDRGIVIDIADADVAAVPYAVTATLTDRGGRAASSTQTISTPGPNQVVFPLTSFRGVSANSIGTIAIRIDPAEGGDLRVNSVRTLGRPGRDSASRAR